MVAYHYTDYNEYLSNHKHMYSGINFGYLPIPEMDGYYFNGWKNENDEYVGYFTPFNGSATTLTADWASPNDYPENRIVYNGHLYEVYEYHMTWEDAQAFCESRGGHLVTITSTVEQSAVESILSQGRNVIYFIGLSDATQEGNWRWVTGENLTYNNWDPDLPEPDSSDERYNYGGIVGHNLGTRKQFGEWLANFNNPDDYYIGYHVSNYGFICEYEFSCRHQYVDTVTAPTCTAQGYTTHTCSVCGDSYKDNYTAALGHNYSYSVTTAPTTSAAGVLTGTCSRCNAQTSVALPKLTTTDYTYTVTKAATCTATGTGRYTWKTTTYGTFYFDVTIPKTAHNYQTAVTPPTCTAQGYTTHTCAVCGDSYKDSYTDALGHAWDNGVVTKPATETEPGIKLYTCTRCGATRTEPIPAIGHVHNYTATVIAPTCTAQGYTLHTCTCGDSYKDNFWLSA